MTTYPLSESATVYSTPGKSNVSSEAMGKGTLEECADIVAKLSADQQVSVIIQMNDIDLKFGPDEVSELLRFLREETSGLSNADIADIKDPEA